MSVIVNYSYFAPKEPMSTADFLPGRKKPESEELSDEEIAAGINAVLVPMAVTVTPK
jgi:hypothetical protein